MAKRRALWKDPPEFLSGLAPFGRSAPSKSGRWWSRAEATADNASGVPRHTIALMAEAFRPGWPIASGFKISIPRG
jgi:hypothetical protein